MPLHLRGTTAPAGRRRAALLAAALAVALLLPACPLSQPASVTVLPRTCEQADCGRGSCDDGGGKRDAVCSCAPGQFRVRPYQCITPEPMAPSATHCTAPEHCPDSQACERLTGQCVTPEPALCGDASRPTGGQQPKGGFCFYAHAPDGKARGCGTVDERDLCSHGLLCASTSPEDMSTVCGYPTNLPGICRPACDPCSRGERGNRCAQGEGCFLVHTEAGDRGVCMPLGRTLGECGEVACAPGESCDLGGTLRGLAVGRCVRHCDPNGGAPGCPPGQQCERHPRFDDAGTCKSLVQPPR